MWYGNSPVLWVFVPLSWLFAIAIACRRFLYQGGLLRSRTVAVPVIVVGNITVGGTGKTPLTIWLANALREMGMTPGIISRGYRGKVGPLPVEATKVSHPEVVGDEAILLAVESGCSVVVHPDRVAAAGKAIELGADVIIADDGLQHYRLARNVEIAVIDGVRGFGNGRLLPAGPLREWPRRLEAVDMVAIHRHSATGHDVLRRATDRRPVHFDLQPASIRRLDGSETGRIEDLAGQSVHAVAAIGNPERFFELLERADIRVKRHPLPDHSGIVAQDLSFDDDLPVVMTAKDAVKCRFPEAGQCWCVDVEVEFKDGEGELLLRRVLDKIADVKAAA